MLQFGEMHMKEHSIIIIKEGVRAEWVRYTMGAFWNKTFEVKFYLLEKGRPSRAKQGY